ncbi:MAG TPA: trehalose-6-phosphate synthase [Steroidobacteraceae bacterium]|nr:trehalose-6-phosphate synthase [Steroidobacteraceae bacterium]
MLRTIFVRLLLPIVLAASVVAFFGLPRAEALLSRWFRADVRQSAGLVMSSMEDPLANLIEHGDAEGLRAYLARTAHDAHLTAIVVCRPNGKTLARTDHTPYNIGCAQSVAAGDDAYVHVAAGPAQISAFNLITTDQQRYRVLLVNDLSFVAHRQTIARRYLLGAAVISAFALATLALGGAWMLLQRWVAILVRDIRDRRFLDDAGTQRLSDPILSQVRQVLSQMEASQRLEIDFQENWTPQALQQVVHDYLHSPQMLVVSNREPCAHVRMPDGSIETQLPASGLVAALEPVMRACAGTWVAHGSGSADHDVVDRLDHVRISAGNGAYTLRRVWLTPEEEAGYYYGFANEGLWPLCHLAYVRPAFRQSDWTTYCEVNRKFAAAVRRELHSARPVVLIQDYHFAVLPRMLREQSPGATIALFWHIPWPSAETFGVCPWKREMLLHMLSADILGFHTRYHCQNFLDTADRYIECRIDREQMSVTLQGHVCHIAPYPISIEWPPRWLASLPDVQVSRAAARERYGIAPEVRLVLGVERWDFTKGILERFLALETLLERQPQYRGRVTLLQVAAPSRAQLPAYQNLQQATFAEAERINHKFAGESSAVAPGEHAGVGPWRPIVLIDEHQPPERVFELYRAADFCLVNSLHDGMNLVAKEFVAARDDEDGVLILSTFAGASRELVEALLINPFDIAETAAALERALAMPREERRERMRLMRRTVKQSNVYRWAGRMLMDAARIRQRQQLTARSQRLGQVRRDATQSVD